MLLTIDMTLTLHRSVNHLIEIHAGLIVGRDDEGCLRVLHVLVRDRIQSFVALRDFMHAALAVELLDAASDLSPR
jgi:hypothetical protein